MTGPENMAPAWCVRTTTNADEVTCRWTVVDVQLLSGVDFQEDALQPHLKKRKIAAKAPRGKAGKPKVIEDAVVEVKVCIPVMVNVVPLKDGQELMSHRPKVEKRAREPAAIAQPGQRCCRLRCDFLIGAVAASSSKLAVPDTRKVGKGFKSKRLGMIYCGEE